MRVPNTGPAEVERQQLIKKLEADLRRIERIPQKRREAECADIAEESCRAMLSDLRMGRPLVADSARRVEDPLRDLLDLPPR